MTTRLIIASVTVLVFFIIIYRGNKQMKLRDTILENMARIENAEVEHIGYVSYHGGYPQIPKPQKLNIALSDEYFLMVTNEGIRGKINYVRVKKCYKFITKKTPDLRGKSVVLWGPFLGIFMKPKIRHFVVVNYLDVNREENNILIECKDNTELGIINDKIQKSWKSYKWRNAKELNTKTNGVKL